MFVCPPVRISIFEAFGFANIAKEKLNLYSQLNLKSEQKVFETKINTGRRLGCTGPGLGK